MDGGYRDPNNPARVPPLLSVIDQPQEGLPRVIHPIGLAVGRPDPTAALTGVLGTMDAFAADVLIEEDVTLVNEQGDPFQFKAGDRISAARASAFPDLAKQGDGKPIRGANDARSLDGAPENKARGAAPENRGNGGGYEDHTVPQLRQIAAARGIDVESNARKPDIVAALEAADAQAPSDPGGELARGNEKTATAPDGDAPTEDGT